MPDKQQDAKTKVLAVASGGGHWMQLMRLRSALQKHHVTYVTTIPGLGEEFDALPCTIVPDASRKEPFRLVGMVLRMTVLIVRIRPQIVISTGAAPGLIALFVGKLLGAKTIWLDSIANAEKLSMSGQLAGRVADLWLTQWPNIATDQGPEYKGAVI